MSSVKELKEALRRHGVSTEGLLERSELVEALNRAEAATGSGTSANSTSELKDLIRHFAGKVSGCFERAGLINRARLMLTDRKALKCRICLDELLDDNRPVVCPIESCVYHCHCLSSWVVKAVEDGRFPVPCPGCLHPLDAFLIQARCPEIYQRFARVSVSLAEQRGHAEDLAPLGSRRCPRCGVWIEKGPTFSVFGLEIVGCDKMTCRCGFKFCFRCGAENARCACTGAEHNFYAA